MTNNPYSFGFPAAGDILSDCYGKGDKAVYARATLDNKVYLETNGGPIELSESNIGGMIADYNYAWALGNLADELIRANRRELGDWINDLIIDNGRAGLVLHFDCQRNFAKYRK